MWVLTLFDLPSLTAFQRRKYHFFRKSLLKFGFNMLQKSVYMRWVDTDAIAEAMRGNIMRYAPEEGMVTVFSLTERALAAFSMRVDGEWQKPPPKPDSFLVL